MSKDMDSFDPNSPNAMFATILARIDGLQGAVHGMREDMNTFQGKVEPRITELEKDKWVRHGIGMAVSVVVSAVFNWFTGGSGKS